MGRPRPKGVSSGHWWKLNYLATHGACGDRWKCRKCPMAAVEAIGHVKRYTCPHPTDKIEFTFTGIGLYGGVAGAWKPSNPCIEIDLRGQSRLGRAAAERMATMCLEEELT